MAFFRNSTNLLYTRVVFEPRKFCSMLGALFAIVFLIPRSFGFSEQKFLRNSQIRLISLIIIRYAVDQAAFFLLAGSLEVSTYDK